MHVRFVCEVALFFVVFSVVVDFFAFVLVSF